MKGSAKVIERLNEALHLELGAINQYWLHYRLLDDWGYGKLAKKEKEESLEEMVHADKLIERILFLGGHPNLQTVAPLNIGTNVKGCWRLILLVKWRLSPLTENRVKFAKLKVTMFP